MAYIWTVFISQNPHLAHQDVNTSVEFQEFYEAALNTLWQQDTSWVKKENFYRHQGEGACNVENPGYIVQYLDNEDNNRLNDGNREQ